MEILVVDDDVISIEFMQIFLESEGHTVTGAYSFAEGCIKSTAARFDLLITDIDLSDGSGVDLAQNVRVANNPYIKVIGVTGYDLEEIRASKHLFDAVLTKPLDLDTLTRQITKLFKRPEANTSSYPDGNHTKQCCSGVKCVQ